MQGVCHICAKITLYLRYYVQIYFLYLVAGIFGGGNDHLPGAVGVLDLWA